LLTSVEVVPPLGASFEGLVMPVQGSSPDDPIFVRNVEGLSPVDAEVNSQGYGQVDGEYYVGSRVGKRNIVLTLGLNVVDVSLPIIYAYFKTKNGVTLKFNVDGWPNAPVYIDGFVETCTYNHFVQDPEVQVSILCPKPNLHKAEVEVTGTSEDGPDYVHIGYNGNEITGFDVTFDVVTTPHSGELFLEWYTGELSLDVRRFGFTDTLLIPVDKTFHWSSVQGKKAAEALPADVDNPYNGLLYAMDNNSFWLTLWPGDNYFRVRTPGNEAYDWTLRYSEQFGGI
jgi:hypothetical protein